MPKESGLYYLQSRYYDPELGRFINADVFTSTGQGLLGNNMFAYCGNNPIIYSDPAGYSPLGAAENSSHRSWLSTYGIYVGGIATYGFVVTTAPTLIEATKETAEKVIEWVESSLGTSERKGNHVYVLSDPDDDNAVKYVGRTNDPGRRLHEHQNDSRHPERQTYQMTVLVAGLTKEQSMLLEQIIISAFTLGYLENARREISIGNVRKYNTYMNAITSIIEGATEDALFDLIGG